MGKTAEKGSIGNWAFQLGRIVKAIEKGKAPDVDVGDGAGGQADKSCARVETASAEAEALGEGAKVGHNGGAADGVR